MIQQSPSLIKITFIDTFAYHCFVLPLTVCILYIYAFMRGVTVMVEPIELAIPVILALVSSGILVWRIREIQRFFDEGVEIQAKITRISRSYRGRAKISFEYTFRDQGYTCTNAVQLWKSVLEIRRGEVMAVLVNPNRPMRAILRDLYAQG